MTYNIEKKFISAINKIDKYPTSDTNKQRIRDFQEQLSAEAISKIRQIKYLTSLSTLLSYFKKDFTDVTKKDVTKVVSEINSKDYYL
jgi:hypothetical protein